VHAQHAGHPVAGDPKYGDAQFNDAMRRLGLTRMFLHASSLSFSWPQGGQFSVNAALPAELAAVLDALESAPRAGGARRAARAPDSRRSAARRRAR